MRTIAFMNQKGGVGKTTTCVNLAAALAERGKKVCMADLDPQAHLTINYGINPSAEMVSLYDVLVDGQGLLAAMQKVGENLAVLPGSIDLAAAEVELVSVIGRETLLKHRVEAAHLDFDFLLLDCPPSLGTLTINALAVAGEVIIPMQPHFLALQGVGKLLETVALVSQRLNPALKVSGIVLTMFDSQTKLSTEVVNDLKSFIDEAAGKNLPWSNARIFSSRIRRNIKLAESPSFGQTILQYDSSSNGASDYRGLAGEVLEMEKPVVKVAVAPEVLATPPVATVPVAAAQPVVAAAPATPIAPVIKAVPVAAPVPTVKSAPAVKAAPVAAITPPVKPTAPIKVAPAVKPAPAVVPSAPVPVASDALPKAKPVKENPKIETRISAQVRNSKLEPKTVSSV
jgi:chromosome partitioning protein